MRFTHKNKSNMAISLCTWGKTCPFQNIPTHREILQWFSWIPVFFGSRCLNINNDFHATEWHVTSTFPITVSCFSSLQHFFFTEDALHLLVIPMEKLWNLFSFCIFYMNGFKVAATSFIQYICCPLPNWTSKANHQILSWFSISSTRPIRFSTT